MSHEELRISRVEWEAAYQQGSIGHSAYMEIYNAYIAVYYAPHETELYDAYLAIVAYYLAPSPPTPTPTPTPPPGGACMIARTFNAISPKLGILLPPIRKFRDRFLPVPITRLYYQFSAFILG